MISTSSHQSSSSKHAQLLIDDALEDANTDSFGWSGSVISLDTETTGVDLHHGARPYLITTCNEYGRQKCWEKDWVVDPLTRQVKVPSVDWAEVCELVLSAESIIMQNGRFDVTAITQGLKDIGIEFEWPWEKCHDTLIAGHLLASNQPHNLTSMCLFWLGKNIQPLEDALEEACKESRRICRTHFKQWRIAREGDPMMPSVTSSSKRGEDKPWKNDTWLPRALAKELELDVDHPWWTVASDYANGDSAHTLLLWQVQREELERRGLYAIYLERMKLLPVTQRIESRGVTVSGCRLEQLLADHKESSANAGQACVEMAADLGFNLQLPKGATNNSLKEFCFDVLKLPVSVYTEGGKSGIPSPALNQAAFVIWNTTLLADSVQHEFIKTLTFKKLRDTQIAFLEGYQRFWLKLDENGEHPEEFGDSYILYSNLNPTGTNTLRFAMYNPNSSNISKRVIEMEEGEGRSIRWTFGPCPGREWWTFDGENLELRLPAYLSGEQELINLFERPNDPPYYGSQHLMNFHTVYPEIWAEVEREVGLEKTAKVCKERFKSTYYQWIKNGDFAIQYQAGDETADRAFHRKGAKAMIKQRFAKLEKLNQDTVRFAEKKGYIETIPDVTVDPLHGYPLLCTRTDRGNILNTIPLSYKIQGSAGWWISKAMVRVDDQHSEWKAKEGFDGFITLQVHDELDVDWPAGGDITKDREREIATKTLACDWSLSDRGTSNLWRARTVQRLMAQGGADFGMPGKTPVGCTYHPHNWADGVDL